jgi:hypothetical protein
VSRLLAFSSSWTPSDNYELYDSQRSEPLVLQAGQPVLLEVTASNWNGPGHVQVAAIVPSSTYR